MNKDLLDNDLEKFLTWFSNQEEIPLQTRRDFFGHLKEVGYLDEKSRKFLENIIPEVLQKKERKFINIKQKVNIFNAAKLVQENKKFSLVENLIENIGGWMMKKALKFKVMVKKNQSQKIKREETAERDLEIDLVAQLKAQFAK